MAKQTDVQTAPLVRSVRRWLLVLVCLFGVLLVGLSAIGYEVSGATDGALYAGIGFLGGLVAVATGIRVLVTLVGRSPSNPTDESVPTE